ncbi:beta-glucanase [Xylariales sp. PMI_506]|nr:beta-glucanase [Xylariales sp. PMI_506]
MYTTNILSAASLALLPGLVLASDPPTYSGYAVEWYANFVGDAGTLPSSENWNVITGNLGVNDELETYTNAAANVQRSGGETLQLTAYRDSSVSGGWTSGRIESVYTFTPQQDGLTMVEARIRFESDTSDNAESRRQGLWPAFWMLGESYRQGTAWPECGEIDAMETVDGVLIGYGTAHCDVASGGLCDETTGLQGSTALADYGWHNWRVVWDNTPGTANWEAQTITWYLDGVAFHTITGSTFTSDHDVWSSLAHKPLYFILNLAVGGDWPGDPNSETLGGIGSFMEVDYVAQYFST